jgi:hypothetical protein
MIIGRMHIGNCSFQIGASGSGDGGQVDGYWTAHYRNNTVNLTSEGTTDRRFNAVGILQSNPDWLPELSITLTRSSDDMDISTSSDDMDTGTWSLEVKELLWDDGIGDYSLQTVLNASYADGDEDYSGNDNIVNENSTSLYFYDGSTNATCILNWIAS